VAVRGNGKNPAHDKIFKQAVHQVKRITNNVDKINNDSSHHQSHSLAETHSLADIEEADSKEDSEKAFANKLKDNRKGTAKDTCSAEGEDKKDKDGKTSDDKAKDSEALKFANRLAAARANQTDLKSVKSVTKKVGKIDPKTKKYIDHHSCSTSFAKKEAEAIKNVVEGH